MDIDYRVSNRIDQNRVRPTRKPSEPRTTSAKKRWLIGVLVFILMLAIALAVFFYSTLQNTNKLTETGNLVEEVSQFMLLPEGEEPTLATVSDKEKLMSQAFFAKAENGDKVLIFSKNGKAILYRPAEKKIINVADINLEQEPTQPIEAPQVQAEIPVNPVTPETTRTEEPPTVNE